MTVRTLQLHAVHVESVVEVPAKARDRALSDVLVAIETGCLRLAVMAGLAARRAEVDYLPLGSLLMRPVANGAFKSGADEVGLVAKAAPENGASLPLDSRVAPQTGRGIGDFLPVSRQGR